MNTALISTSVVLVVFTLITVIRINKRRKDTKKDISKVVVEKEDMTNANKMACAKSLKGY